MADQNGTNGTNGRIKIDPGFAIQLLAWIVAAVLTYGAINARVAVVESQINIFRGDLNEIKQDLKSLLRRP
jgi:hypothetical protein